MSAKLMLAAAGMLIAVSVIAWFSSTEESVPGDPEMFARDDALQVTVPEHRENDIGLEDDSGDLSLPMTSNDQEDKEFVSFGETMDADDPASWLDPSATEPRIIGEYLDPNDPSSWPSQEEVNNYGEYKDPNDPSAWYADQQSETRIIGEYMDANDPSTWITPPNNLIRNIGAYADPDDPSTWDTDNE